MTLRLSVVSEHGIRLGAKSTKVFGVHGGTIGRGTDNEWILPDPERYLSGKHARIDFRAGSYILVDTSSNGTYVNGSQVPLGKYHDYTLKDGDYVRLGEYELLVSIDQSNDFPPDQDAIVAYDGHSPSAAVKKSTANDLGADLDLSQLLEPSGDLLGQEAPPRARIPGEQAAGSPPEQDSSGTPWHMMTRPLKIEARNAPAGPAPAAGGGVASGELAPGAATSAAGARGSLSGSFPSLRAQQAPALFDGELEAGLTAFCRGAGIDVRNISPEGRGAALHLAGQLLRESLLGLMELNQGRSELRNRFRIPAPQEDGADSPLKFSRGVDEAIVRLLTTLSTRAGSVDAVRDNFKELKAHHAATLAAMHSAFEAFVERVEPKELEERFDRAAKKGMFGGQNKAKYWDLYAEMFPGLAQRPPDGFPHLFIEGFARAYEAKLRTLVPPRRSAFGADRSDPVADDGAAVGDR
jgi:type VI secretion system protein